jgi:hypothetical protein
MGNSAQVSVWLLDYLGTATQEQRRAGDPITNRQGRFNELGSRSWFGVSRFFI